MGGNLAISQTMGGKRKNKRKKLKKEKKEKELEDNSHRNNINEENGNIYKALYDYTSTESTDLTFSENDKMEIIDKSDNDWWTAKLLTTGETGLVPNNYIVEDDSLESNSWYFGDISRKECERLLLGSNRSGVYMVRESEKMPGNYTLSNTFMVKSTKQIGIKHYRIKTRDSDIYIHEPNYFKSWNELIKFYTETDHGICCSLKTPCERPAPELTDLSSDTREHWEINRNDLTLITILGSGNFGDVYKARYQNNHEVAVKTLKTGTMSVDQFLAEAEVMKKCQHDHLVTLFAICSKEEPIYIITELMDGGSLLSFLKKTDNLDKEDFLDFSAQCASGMAYLEDKKFVHRDLAARNVLVSLERKRLKIADFGLARAITEDVYEAHTGAKFPVKWTALEAIEYSTFTIKSDVWSYGILLFEIFTKGQHPYSRMKNDEVVQKLMNGYRMPKHDLVPDPVYDCMLRCWDKKPDQRPTFEHLNYFFEYYETVSEDNYFG